MCIASPCGSVHKIFKAYGMFDCKKIGIRMEVNVKLSIEDNSSLVDIGSYKKLIRSLIDLCNTRPNLAYSIGA